jgi:hypothetical protein
MSKEIMFPGCDGHRNSMEHGTEQLSLFGSIVDNWGKHHLAHEIPSQRSMIEVAIRRGRET